MAYTNENELRQALMAVRDRLAIKDKTEAQALVLSSTYPNCVYYTSDTHCIVIGGNIYGRGEQIVASNFAFLPASEPGPGHDPTFQDTTKIYVQPDSSNPGYFKLWWYLQSDSTWINGGSFPLDIPLTAEDISYDLTPTPDLGTGDVQSAIEAVDGKVGDVDQRIDDEKVEFIKHMPLGDISYNGITFNRQTAITYSDANGIITFSAATGSGNTTYGLRWSYSIIPKGTVVRVKFTRTGTQWFLIAYSTDSPQDYRTEHGTIVGFTAKRLFSSKAKEINYVEIMPEDGYLLIRDYAAAEPERTPGIQINLYSLDMLTKMYDYKFDFIKEWMPYGGDVSSVYGQTNINNSNNRISADGLEMVSAGATNCSYTLNQIPKGSLLHFTGIYKSNTTFATIFRVSYVKESPSEYYSEHGNTLVGMKLDGVLYSTLRANSVDEWFIMPETAYVIWNGSYAYSNSMHLYVYPSYPFKKWYSKGVADGSGMASIVGLGYNIWDYITGAVNMAGFEYGCKIYKDYIFKPTVSLREKWSRNTSLVYFPKFDMTGLPTSDSLPLYRFLQYTTSLKIVPDLTFASNVQFSLSESFQYSSVVYVGSFVNLKITNVMGCFKECRSLLSVGNLDTSLITTWRTGSNQIFVSTNTDGVKRVESLDFTSTTTGASNEAWISNGNLTGLRYIVIKNIGTASGCTSIAMTRLTQWGIPHASYPSLTSDARQSLIDTLLTYSFDRATAGYSTCTVTLSAATKALLTTEELEQITAKGYTIA